MASDTSLYPPINVPFLEKSTGFPTLPWIMFFQRLVTANTGNAPVDAEYIVGAADAVLTAERVATNSTSNTWNLATAGQAKVERAALTGDVTASANSNTTALSTTGVSAGSYGDSTHVGAFTVDAAGRLSAASSVAIAATGTVTTTGSPASGNLTKFSGATSITNGDLSGDVTTSGALVATLANTAVTPGSYTNTSLTVNSKGLITAASNGSAGSTTDYVVMSDGANPPNPVDDGNGNFIYVTYTP